MSIGEDTALSLACKIVDDALSDAAKRPDVTAFFDKETNTASYVVRDPESQACAVIDSVLDFDAASGRTQTRSVDRILSFIREGALELCWDFETHVHADHLSAAPIIKDRLGGGLAIGENINIIQTVFGNIFNAGSKFQRDGSQFDRLLKDGERLSIGGLDGVVLHTPGHTPACVTLVIGDAAFVGDTLFMPDYGTARADFPGGDARQLYRSIRRILCLPEATRIFLCHDYKAPGRDQYCWETSVGAERKHNVHIHDGVTEDEFIAMRTRRDACLATPKLFLPSVQVNMRAGALPPPEDNGRRYLKIPLD